MPPNQNREIRMAFKITKNGNGHQGVFYNLEAGRQPTSVPSLSKAIW